LEQLALAQLFVLLLPWYRQAGTRWLPAERFRIIFVTFPSWQSKAVSDKAGVNLKKSGPALSGLIPANKPQRNISHKKAQNAQKGKGIKGLFCAFCAFLRLKRFWFLFWN